MPYKTIFFDLDDTLYDAKSGVWPLMIARINQYMHEVVGIAEDKIPDLRLEYLKNYGTSLRGLHIHYDVDPDDYLRFVHDVPIEDYLQHNTVLEQMLGRLPQKKWVFTNASREHAERVLEALGIGAHFDNIIDVKAMSFRSKPETRVYTLAMEMAGATQASQCLLVEDRVENLEPAKELGMGTMLVGTKEPHPAADKSISRIEDLLDALPQLVE
jgi:putative hydrolase of the HAD superfamily